MSRKQNGHTPSLPAGDAGAPGAACGTEPRFLRGPSPWAAVFNFSNEKQHRRDHGDASASELRFRRSREMPRVAHAPLIRAIALFTEHVLQFMSHRKKKDRRGLASPCACPRVWAAFPCDRLGSRFAVFVRIGLSILRLNWGLTFSPMNLKGKRESARRPEAPRGTPPSAGPGPAESCRRPCPPAGRGWTQPEVSPFLQRDREQHTRH